MHLGASLVVQWLKLHASNGGGTKIPHAVCHGQKNGGGGTPHQGGCIQRVGVGVTEVIL